MILVQWKLRETQNHLLQYHRGVLVFFYLQFSIFQMMYVHQWYKRNFFSLRPRFIDHLFCYFWLSSSSTPKFSNFSHSLSTAAFAAWIFHSLRHKNQSICDKNCNAVINCLLSCNMVFMMIWYRISQTHSCRFITRKFCFTFVGFTTPTILLHNFARHSGNHWRFQFLTSILDGAPKFLVLRVNKLDPSQFSCVIQMELLIRPLLLLPSA